MTDRRRVWVATAITATTVVALILVAWAIWAVTRALVAGIWRNIATITAVIGARVATTAIVGSAITTIGSTVTRGTVCAWTVISLIIAYL